MYKFPKFKAILDKLNELPNVRVRFSSESVEGDFTNEHASTIIPYADSPTKAFICEAYSRGGKCGECRACWHKDVPMIAYVAHGIKMNKVIEARAV